jgi:2-polyprenyl-6-methoxyphenol hydroxylase-like FAD-dependent oxidoreductase
MTEALTTDALICGAGATGLTLGIELARRGVRFRLIDKLEQPFQGSRGKGIQPRTQEIFDQLGILDRIVARGGVYPPQWKYRGDGSYVETEIAARRGPTPAEPYFIPLMIPQFLTESVMRDRLAELGHAVEFGTGLHDFEQDDEGVTARVVGSRGEERIRARYLIGADGGRSLVRRALGIDFPGQTLGVRAVVADVSLTGLPRSAWHTFNSESMASQISLCPLAGTDLFQLLAPIPLEGEVDLSAQGLTALVANRTRRKDICIGAVPWASVYNLNARLADRYRVGRAFLAGDAAHVHPPTGGQGLNTGIQDAFNLGWKLAMVLGGGAHALLDTYEEERRPIAEGVLGLSTKLLEAAKRGDMRRGREVHQLDIGYRGSTLALDSPTRGGDMRAGDRAPDAPIRGAGGQPRRLFELLVGPQWTLLEYEGGRDCVGSRAGLRIHSIGSQGDLIDHAGEFKKAYGLSSGDRVLVRPDGYIGAIIAPQELGLLERYLGKWASIATH